MVTSSRTRPSPLASGSSSAAPSQRGAPASWRWPASGSARSAVTCPPAASQRPAPSSVAITSARLIPASGSLGSGLPANWPFRPTTPPAVKPRQICPFRLPAVCQLSRPFNSAPGCKASATSPSCIRPSAAPDSWACHRLPVTEVAASGGAGSSNRAGARATSPTITPRSSASIRITVHSEPAAAPAPIGPGCGWLPVVRSPGHRSAQAPWPSRSAGGH